MVREQGVRLGRPVLPHLNHPNFRWGVTAEEMASVIEERFFEVYNGHPDVHNLGARRGRGWDGGVAGDTPARERRYRSACPTQWGIARNRTARRLRRGAAKRHGDVMFEG